MTKKPYTPVHAFYVSAHDALVSVDLSLVDFLE